MSKEIETLYTIAKQKGISQSEIARRHNTTRSYISKLKQDGVEVCINKFKEIAEVVGCELELIDKDTGLRYKI